MGSLHNPSLGSIPAIVLLGLAFLATLANVWNVIPLHYHHLCRLSDVALVRTQVLDLGLWTTDYEGG
jgi:hypothetical protein